MAEKTCHYIVYGRVQGVAFRYYTRTQAELLGLRGTVANRTDGTVEVFAQGEEESLALFEDYLGRGPVMARVDKVERNELPGNDFFPGFRVLPDSAV